MAVPSWSAIEQRSRSRASAGAAMKRPSARVARMTLQNAYRSRRRRTLRDPLVW